MMELEIVVRVVGGVDTATVRSADQEHLVERARPGLSRYRGLP